MPRTRIRDTNIEDISTVTELEFNNFFQAVVITGTLTDTTVTQSFADFFPGQGLIGGAGSVTVITGSNFVTLSGAAGGGGGLDNVVEDTTPELGGNLDALTRDITNVGALTADTGTFTTGLTVSGVPVATGTLQGPSVYAHLGTNQTISTSSATKVQYDTVTRIDTHGGFDTTNNRYIPPVAGLYFISATARYSTDLGADTPQRIVIHKNGSTYSRGPLTSEGITSGGQTMTTIAEANGTTDFFEAFVLQQGGSNATLLAGVSDNFFIATLIK